MAYTFYLNRVMMPITPPSMSVTTPNKNETIELIDGSEINVLKEPGLKTFQFELVLPQIEYPFANYKNGKFRKAKEYLDEFEVFKKSKQPFQFIITRFIKIVFVDGATNGSFNSSFNTSVRVSLEDYEVLEDSENGFDITVSITLKEYADYGTKELVPIVDPTTGDPALVVDDPDRPVEPNLTILPNQRRTYTVKSGDSLWAICARELGNGDKCWDVAKKNNIADPGSIQPGQTIDLTGF